MGKTERWLLFKYVGREIFGAVFSGAGAHAKSATR
jgi:hypothetical protein